MKNFYFHHYFSQGKAGQVSSASFMLSFVVELAQILPFSSTHLGIFILISILRGARKLN